MHTVRRLLSSTLALVCFFHCATGAEFDAAPSALPLPEGHGLLWEDPREIHKVIVQFKGSVPPADSVHLEYWGSRWPEQHLPKDRQPGGGDVGWTELGNWYQGGWRVADTDSKTKGSSITFSFRPVNAKEFPKLTNYTATFRYTLKLRVVGERVSEIQNIQAFTDSRVEERGARLVWEQSPPEVKVSVFNGQLRSMTKQSGQRLVLLATTNSDPNSFDRTLVTVSGGKGPFTFAIDDLAQGPLFLPHLGVAVLPETDGRDYPAILAEKKSARAITQYERISQMPEQTWENAWSNMPPKKSRINFPLGLDGGRQRFQLWPDGSIHFRLWDHFMEARPGQDTPRLKAAPGPMAFRFGLSLKPVHRELEQGTLPICETTWETNGLKIQQTVFVTQLSGTKPEGPVPDSDSLVVAMVRFAFTNQSSTPQIVPFLTRAMEFQVSEKPQPLTADADGLLSVNKRVVGQMTTNKSSGNLSEPWSLEPNESATVTLKIPYLAVEPGTEQEMLKALDFQGEKQAVAAYWKRRLDESAQLVTPEPVLNEFYRAQASHLLINCEREPGSTRRFARVGSYYYGAYGNESCMMVVDLERRGYHREAQECLDAWLHYQGTVELPGDFASKQGVLYGAGGYESGGYNQHHGWILWCLAEHYRFTRDTGWLRSAAPGILAGADWIIRESRRTLDRHPLERGLLPPGDLEDIGDWWTWLSTSCYTWRGLDSAAWALEQIKHPEARRIRLETEAFHSHLLQNFRAAAQRSPVVRLREGTAVAHFPSYVHRRGRSFGWICETLEGALHLLITGALDARSPEADWILKDYEDNLYLSNQYGYTLDDFDRYWLNRGGMSMQACLLLDVEPYLYRDDVKQALRAMFNAIAVSHFPDVHMNTEHALPEMGDWRGDHFKTSDEANACGWLRQIFVREQGNELLVGQAVPRDWLRPGRDCGLERGATYFGPISILYRGEPGKITAQLQGPTRNPPGRIRLRFRTPDQQPLAMVTVNGRQHAFRGDWVELPGNIGTSTIEARY
jgi:hypothetical protein